jgi:hypothetical protein
VTALHRVLAGWGAMVLTWGLLEGVTLLAHGQKARAVQAALQTPQVLRAQVAYAPSPSPPTVTLWLAAGTDPQEVVERLSSRLVPLLGTVPRWRLVGPAQESLAKALDSLSLAVQEGLATGQYVPMAQEVARLAHRQGLRAQVEVDSMGAYLSLRDAHGGEAYAFYPRLPQPQGVSP